MKKIFVILIFVQLIVLVVLIFCFVYFPNTDIEATRKVLILNNYKPIKIGGEGSSKLWYSTKFKAIAPNGDTCEGSVSKSLFFNDNVISIEQ